MHVTGGNGVEVASGGKHLFLDPKRQTTDAVVTHGHTDHLMPGALMTPPTHDFLRIRRPARSGTQAAYGKRVTVADLDVTLHDAGHVLGSAMVEVETPEGRLVYTGDFNPNESLTCGAARPLACDVLVMESTYGDPRFDLPPQAMVRESLEAWTLQRLLDGPVALGAYPLGRAQELIALANRAGITPVVPPQVGALTAVYNAHGHDLRYAVSGTERARDLEEGSALHVVPREQLKRGHPFVTRLRQEGGSAAYLSGWCHRFQYFKGYDIDAQFALSDHAGFRDLIAHVERVQPSKVYTMHGAAVKLAQEIRDRLGIQAEALSKPSAG